MQRLAITLAAVFLCTISAFTSAQAETYSMDQITRSLQNEYKTQLERKPRRHVSKPKRPTKRSVNKISKQTIDRILQKPAAKRAPQVRQRPQQPRQVAHKPVARTQQHVAKPPAPHAEDLFNAAAGGSVNYISRLLSQGVNINASNDQRETALHMATARGHHSAVIYLINHGANIHARTVNNWLPIHHAARFRRAVIANYLIQRGSSPHARTSDGMSAIDMAKINKDQRMLGIFGVR